MAGNERTPVAVGHGLVSLRKRYAQRAQTLLTEREFQKACADLRQKWNSKHPRYVLPTAMNELGFPETLVRDYVPALEAFEGEEGGRDDLPDQDDSEPDRFYFMLEQQDRRSRKPTLRAYDDWKEAVRCLVEGFFPARDFPNPTDETGHPASAFVGCVVGSRNVETVRELLDPMIHVELDIHKELTLEDDPVFTLGLYPGITPQDIRESATVIAERVNTRYADRLPLARILDLRSEGWTQREIGVQLGLTERAVKDALTLAT